MWAWCPIVPIALTWSLHRLLSTWTHPIHVAEPACPPLPLDRDLPLLFACAFPAPSICSSCPICGGPYCTGPRECPHCTVSLLRSREPLRGGHSPHQINSDRHTGGGAEGRVWDEGGFHLDLMCLGGNLRGLPCCGGSFPDEQMDGCSWHTLVPS